MFTKTRRAIATIAAAAITLSTIGLQPAFADYRRHNNDAAAAAAMIAIFGTVAALIAADQARDNHRRHYRHYGPAYGGPDRVPHGRYWRQHHHR
jgi:hypothetical protein